MTPKAKRRLERFKLRMSNPMFYLRQSNRSFAGECPFCGGENNDHEDDCELDE